MKKRSIRILLTMFLLLCLAGCASQEAQMEDMSTQTKEETVDPVQVKLGKISPSAYSNTDGLDMEEGTYISLIGKSGGGAFWTEVSRGAKQAVQELNERLGYSGNDKVKVVYSGSEEEEDVDEQVNILDEELARYPSAVAISIVDTQSCEVQFDLAAENDIPIVAFDSGSDYKGLMSTVSTDNQKASAEVADRMAEAVGNGEVVMVIHDSASETGKLRETAFTEEISSYSEIQVSAVYHLDELSQQIADEINQGLYRTDGTETTGEPLAEEDWIGSESVTQEDMIAYIVKKHPQMKGCYTTSATVTGLVMNELDKQGLSGVTLMGYDTDDDLIAGVRDGKVAGLLVQNPYGMGYAAVVAAARSALDLGNEANVDTGYIWVTKENIDDEDVQAMLYDAS